MKPVIADGQPQKVTLESGKEYYWCACGRSKNQPFCDGSHVDTDITPTAFTPTKSGDAYLCMCKHTATPPYCDGAHKSLGDEPDTAG